MAAAEGSALHLHRFPHQAVPARMLSTGRAPWGGGRGASDGARGGARHSLHSSCICLAWFHWPHSTACPKGIPFSPLHQLSPHRTHTPTAWRHSNKPCGLLAGKWPWARMSSSSVSLARTCSPQLTPFAAFRESLHGRTPSLWSHNSHPMKKYPSCCES